MSNGSGRGKGADDGGNGRPANAPSTAGNPSGGGRGSRPLRSEAHDRLLEAVGVTPLAMLTGKPERSFRAVFMPSFHRDVCITATVGRDGGELEIALVDLQGRTAALAARSVAGRGRAWAGEVPPWAAPARLVRAALDPDRTEALVRAIDTLDRELLAAPPGFGLDGLTLEGVIAGAGEILHFTAWSPRAHEQPAQHAYFAALYELAVETVDDSEVCLALEHLHTYLDLGLPVVDLGGVPRRVRIFGELSYPPSSDLTMLLESLVSDEPLVMDMGNFQGMGTMLQPLFHTLAQRPGPTTWCASAAARAHLAEIGVEASAIFDGIEDALAECARRAS